MLPGHSAWNRPREFLRGFFDGATVIIAALFFFASFSATAEHRKIETSENPQGISASTTVSGVIVTVRSNRLVASGPRRVAVPSPRRSLNIAAYNSPQIATGRNIPNVVQSSPLILTEFVASVAPVTLGPLHHTVTPETSRLLEALRPKLGEANLSGPPASGGAPAAAAAQAAPVPSTPAEAQAAFSSAIGSFLRNPNADAMVMDFGAAAPTLFGPRNPISGTSVTPGRNVPIETATFTSLTSLPDMDIPLARSVVSQPLPVSRAPRITPLPILSEKQIDGALARQVPTGSYNSRTEEYNISRAAAGPVPGTRGVMFLLRGAEGNDLRRASAERLGWEVKYASSLESMQRQIRALPPGEYSFGMSHHAGFADAGGVSGIKWGDRRLEARSPAMDSLVGTIGDVRENNGVNAHRFAVMSCWAGSTCEQGNKHFLAEFTRRTGVQSVGSPDSVGKDRSYTTSSATITQFVPDPTPPSTEEEEELALASPSPSPTPTPTP